MKRLEQGSPGEDDRRPRGHSAHKKQPASKSRAPRNRNVIRVFVADRHHLVRRGLKMVLGNEPGFVFCGEAQSNTDITAGVSATRPDVLILGVTAKPDAELEFIAQLHRQFPELRLLVFTMHGNPLIAERTFELGATGYLLQTEAPEKLIAAVAAVAQGRRYVTASVDPALLDRPAGLEWKKQNGAWVLLDKKAHLRWMLANGDWVVRPR